jgi:HD-GYP domain-containing protein (c-di-GMP phosphodiesterase class II)
MIIQDVPSLDEVRAAVVSHHECYDGTGYPYGLRGSEIPMLGRILAVADAYSAMTTDRPYRKALSEEQAVAELLANAGTCFDPRVVQPFVSEVLGVGQGRMKEISAQADVGQLSGSILATWRDGL